MEEKELTKTFILKEFPFLKEIVKTTKLIGRKEELEMLEESLYKKRMKNSVLIGEAGVGKTTIIEELSNKIKNKFIVFQMDVAGAVSGTKFRGEFEERLTKVLEAIKNFNITHERQIILFVDEIHTLYKAGGAEGAIDASNILKPYLSKGEITIIGATTPTEYKNTIAKDLALKRRLPAVYIEPLNEYDIKTILKEFSDGLVSDIGIDYIYRASQKLSGYQNPDISLEIMDRAIAKHKCRKIDITSEMIDNIIEYMRKEI